MGTLASLAVVVIMIAGLLFTVGAKTLAKRLLVLGLIMAAAPLLWDFLICTASSIRLSGVPVPAWFWGIIALGLLGTVHAYIYLRRRKERQKQADAARLHAPEPVPALSPHRDTKPGDRP